MDEADSVIEPDGNIAEPFGHLLGELDEHGLDQLFVLAGGLGPQTLDAVLQAEPEIVIVGSAITGADQPRGVAKWIKDRLRNPGRGWPSDAR